MTSSGKPPTYLDIAADYRQKIVSGEWPPGTKIPSVRITADTYRVSSGTAEKAIRELSREGLIEAWPGIGNVVVGPGEVSQTG